MPEDRQFSERDLERNLRDLGAGVEYPPTPDVARTVRLRLDEDRDQRSRRSWHWPPFLAQRWTAVAAALVVVSVIALFPVVRTTLSDLFVSSHQTSSEAGDSAARPESGVPEENASQETGVASKAAGASAGGEGKGAIGCPDPAIEVKPARGAAGTKFRLGGHNFSSGCDRVRITPARGVRIYFLQSGKTWRLSTLDADRGLTFETRLIVPVDAEPGPATLRATTRSGEPVEERFVVLR